MLPTGSVRGNKKKEPHGADSKNHKSKHCKGMENKFIRQEDIPELLAFLAGRVENTGDSVSISLRKSGSGIEMSIQMMSQDWRVHSVFTQPEATPLEEVAKSLIEEGKR